MTCGDERGKKGSFFSIFLAETCSECGRKEQIQKWWIFRERRFNFSLRSRAIGPSDFDGARRKAVLRGEDKAWTPVLGVFDKLREVGVSPYLVFIPSLSVFQCFGWIEALNGRLIGPKTWDRIVGIFFRIFRGRFFTVRGYGLFGLIVC